MRKFEELAPLRDEALRPTSDPSATALYLHASRRNGGSRSRSFKDWTGRRRKVVLDWMSGLDETGSASKQEEGGVATDGVVDGK